CVCRRDRVEEIGGFREGYEGAEDWDLVIRLAERISPTDVRHVPYVLYRSRALPGSTTRAVGEQQVAAVERRALTEHLDRRGETAEVLPVAPHCWRIRRPLPDPTPLVSVIIPTR